MKWFKPELLVLVLCASIKLSAQQTNVGSKRFEELKIKADHGDGSSQFDLGRLYLAGIGVERNEKEGLKWWRKAAEQGVAEAQCQIGGRYITGVGVEMNLSEAIKWLIKATDQGSIESEKMLGTAYDMEANYAEAIKIWRKLAEKDDAVGESGLANCYVWGKGVEINFVEAQKWARKAATQGDPGAQCYLGTGFLNGQGVIKDYIEAYKWLDLAAAAGIVYAQSNLLTLEEKMIPTQIAEGQRRAAAFKPRKQGELDTIADLQLESTGTGFFITEDGYLISNYHVVKGAAKVRLLTGAGLIDVTVVKVDAANDLALLKAVGRFAPLPIAASRTVKLGGTVATVGFPDIGLQGFAPKLAKGEIASLAGAADDPRYFQISLPVQHGNSGGALVDVHGNVVGIVAARLGVEIGKAVTSDELPENVNYAVKSSLLLSFLESVPDVDAKLKEPTTKEESFEDVVKSAQDAAVLVLVY